jgi:hypothetical protein
MLLVKLLQEKEVVVVKCCMNIQMERVVYLDK